MKKKKKMTDECKDNERLKIETHTPVFDHPSQEGMPDESDNSQFSTLNSQFLDDPDPADEEVDAFFAELQAAWDAHSRRIDEFVARNRENLDQYNHQIVQAIQRRHRARRIKTAALLLSVPVAMFFIYVYCYPFLRTFYSLILAAVAAYSFFGHEREGNPYYQYSVLSLPLVSACRSRVVGCVALALIASTVCFPAADGNNISALDRSTRTTVMADIGTVLNNTPPMS